MEPRDHGGTIVSGAPLTVEEHQMTTAMNLARFGRSAATERAWVDDAIRRLEADANRSADTHLHIFPLPPEWQIQLYLKDESVHPTGSLKHRLARSLILYGLVSGLITSNTTLVEASSGSTAVSEAYFAKMLGLPFITIVPRGTSTEKISQIEFYGGRCYYVEQPLEVYSEAARVAAEHGGYYLDQFSLAERATDWRGNNNIADSIFEQMKHEPHSTPHWIVVGAGTGGTSATIGRYLRYRRLPTQLAVVDPENSAFAPGWRNRDPLFSTGAASRIEGIGRPRMEPSFLPSVVDDVISVPDAASVAASLFLRERTRHWAGGSTGTNLIGAFKKVSELLSEGQSGSVVTLICDTGARYSSTYYDSEWVKRQGWDTAAESRILSDFLATGVWQGC